MDVCKAFMLAGTAAMLVSALAPPKRAARQPSAKGAVYTGQPFEFVVRYLAYIACIAVSAAAFCHSMLLLYRARVLHIEPLVPWLCPSNPPLAPLSSISTRFLVGVSMVVAGTAIRLFAYHALGSLFTYEVVVKDDHKLVTAGPYRHVRHPSYTGVALLLLGTHLIYYGDAGYVTYCDVSSTPMVFFVHFWRYAAPFTVFSLCRRCGVEDGQLRERFGMNWEKYKREVPYVLVPFVY